MTRKVDNSLIFLNKTITRSDLEGSIIAILERGRPVPISVISFILDVPGWKIHKKLEQLKKWGIVTPATKQIETFWKKIEVDHPRQEI